MEIARRLGYIGTNPADLVILPRLEPTKVRTLDKDELIDFLNIKIAQTVVHRKVCSFLCKIAFQEDQYMTKVPLSPFDASDAQDQVLAFSNLHEQFLRELSEAQQADYAGMVDGTMYGALAFSFGAMSFEEFQAQN